MIHLSASACCLVHILLAQNGLFKLSQRALHSFRSDQKYMDSCLKAVFGVVNLSFH